MKRIIFSLSDDLLLDIDSVCRKKRYDRAEFIRMCLRDELYNGAVYGNDPAPKSFMLSPEGPVASGPDKSAIFGKLKEQFSEPIYSKEDLWKIVKLKVLFLCWLLSSLF